MTSHRTRGRTSARSVAILSAEVELAGYRVVQESLTNTIRYAPGAAAMVRVAYGADGIMLDVLDDGPGPLTVAIPV